MSDSVAPPRSLYLGSSTSNQASLNPFVDPLPPVPGSATTSSTNHSKFKEHLSFIDVPITPGPGPARIVVDLPQRARSHFSPSTPSMERGFAKGGDEKRDSLLDRVGHAIGWSSRAASDRCACGHGKRKLTEWIWISILALVFLLLLINVIVIDTRMSSMMQTINRINQVNAARPSTAAAVGPPSSAIPVALSPTPSATSSSPSSSPSPSSTPNSSGSSNLANIPVQAASCIAQFAPSAVRPTDPSTYCTQCVPALQTIPPGWFTAQTGNTGDGSANIQAVSDAADFCNNASMGAGSKSASVPASQPSVSPARRRFRRRASS